MKQIRLTIILLVVFVFASTVLAQSQSDSTRHATSGAVVATRSGDASFEYQLLKQTVAVWSDGRGDVILERRLRNTGTVLWSRTTWYFDWPPGDYSNIRAWDANGPLNVGTSQVGSRIFVTVYFRDIVPIGQSYQFNLAITIGGMASGIDNDWRARWYTYPGAPIDQYIQGVTFPSNATLESVTPTPTVQRANYVEWRNTNTPSNFEHSIDVRYTLSNTATVPLFLQNNSVLNSPSAPWSGNPYGRYASNDTVNTIGRYGCYMTSAAMIINYWAANNGLGFRTTPGDFNNWLRANGGYDASHAVVHQKIIDYARANGVSLYNTGHIQGRNDAVLDDYLRTGNPVILGVGGHYVVATGKTSVNGVETYAINDPIYGRTTLMERWNNSYVSILLLSGTPSDQRSLRVSAHSPIELLVTDPDGRKLGYDPQNDIDYSSIPNAGYFVESIAPNGDLSQSGWIESKMLIIYAPLDGEYSVEVHGTGEGEYEINTYAADWLGRVTSKIERGSAQEGSLDEIGIEYDSDIGLPVSGYSAFLPIAVDR